MLAPVAGVAAALCGAAAARARGASAAAPLRDRAAPVAAGAATLAVTALWFTASAHALLQPTVRPPSTGDVCVPAAAHTGTLIDAVAATLPLTVPPTAGHLPASATSKVSAVLHVVAAGVFGAAAFVALAPALPAPPPQQPSPASAAPASPPPAFPPPGADSAPVRVAKSPSGGLGARFEGLTLKAVRSGTPADALGGYVGRTVASVNGTPVRSFNALSDLVSAADGDVELSFWQRDEEPALTSPHKQPSPPVSPVTTTTQRNHSKSPPFGARFEGCLLTGVGRGTMAAEAGLRKRIGSRATHVNGVMVRSFSELQREVSQATSAGRRPSFRFEDDKARRESDAAQVAAAAVDELFDQDEQPDLEPRRSQPLTPAVAPSALAAPSTPAAKRKSERFEGGTETQVSEASNEGVSPGALRRWAKRHDAAPATQPTDPLPPVEIEISPPSVREPRVPAPAPTPPPPVPSIPCPSLSPEPRVVRPLSPAMYSAGGVFAVRRPVDPAEVVPVASDIFTPRLPPPMPYGSPRAFPEPFASPRPGGLGFTAPRHFVTPCYAAPPPVASPPPPSPSEVPVPYASIAASAARRAIAATQGSHTARASASRSRSPEQRSAAAGVAAAREAVAAAERRVLSAVDSAACAQLRVGGRDVT
eukprot:TRINITY_DN21720_c0_g1_i2.p1 TRINITY_DN21720_c0_g1~~TRINITY_DN21720_c0_g1_i2.p1  ORF type:complete len:666 (+),score=177.41 TRINITY_DN21720_c0_g1_i2:57-2000(+)